MRIRRPPTASPCRDNADAGRARGSDHYACSIPIAAYGTPSTAETARAVRKYSGSRRYAPGQSRRRHCGPDVNGGVLQEETIEHFAKISLGLALGGENLISRDEVERLQGLRGMYGIASPAPLCADPSDAPAGDQVVCQVLEAPEGSDRLVPDVTAMLQRASRDGEIRLTYGELTALIADAVKNLRDG